MLNKLVRKNILKLVPYSSARDEYKGENGVFLDANENPYGIINRYPDPYQTELKNKISKLKNIAYENIFIGNGSDEIIDLVFRIFCEPAIDKALIFTPTYGMYKVAADINDIEILKIPLNSDFDIDKSSVLNILNLHNLKLIFLCSPNNPTGNSYSPKIVEFILKNFKGIVFIDEAYVDFSAKESWKEKINIYNNLIVSQTFSKAFGSAGARVGMAFADKKIIELFNKVKPPYNVSTVNQKVVAKTLDNILDYEKNKLLILSEKERLKKELLKLNLVKKIYNSDANFFLVEVENADFLYNYLIKKQIIIRNRSSLVKNCVRITVGTKEENNKLLLEMKQI